MGPPLLTLGSWWAWHWAWRFDINNQTRDCTDRGIHSVLCWASVHSLAAGAWTVSFLFCFLAPFCPPPSAIRMYFRGSSLFLRSSTHCVFGDIYPLSKTGLEWRPF